MISGMYSRLEAGQIRLLLISPGAFSDSLQFEFRTVSLDDKPRYEALSYVWGDSGVTKTIQLCGVSHQATVNLESALRHLRLERQQRLIWVDAVCINQADLVERGHQVSQMGRIYASAERVLAWLGEATEDSDMAYEGIQLFTSNPTLHWTRPVISLAPFRNSNVHWTLPVTVKSLASIRKAEYVQGERYYMAFRDLSTRPWWSRGWIVHEALLAKDLIFVCDIRGKIPVDDGWPRMASVINFRRAISAEISGISALDETSNDPEERSHRLARIKALEWGPESNKNRYFLLLDQIINYRDRLCTDPRDKIYALLGMVSSLKNELTPDYSVPYNQIYADFAFRVMCEQENLDILTILIPGQFKSSNPSWAPDWRYQVAVDDQLIEPMLGDKALYQRFNNLCYFNAGASLPCVVDLPLPLVLSVEGCICDEVEFLASYRLGAPYGSPEAFLLRNRLIDISEIDCGPFSVNMNTATNTFLGYPRATTGSHLWGSWFYIMYSRFFAKGTNTFHRAVKAFRNKFLHNSTWYYLWHEKADVFDEVIWLRKYAMTKNDFVGFVPYAAQPGDKICILFGGRVPYILREIPGEIEVEGKKYPKHMVIGDCYIHDLMQGEGVKMMERGETARQKFYLH